MVWNQTVFHKRGDMIKASILASFDVEATIPQIIEKIYYINYSKDKGWNIETNEFELIWSFWQKCRCFSYI